MLALCTKPVLIHCQVEMRDKHSYTATRNNHRKTALMEMLEKLYFSKHMRAGRVTMCSSAHLSKLLVTESGMVEAGRHLWRSLIPAPCSRRIPWST